MKSVKNRYVEESKRAYQLSHCAQRYVQAHMTLEHHRNVLLHWHRIKSFRLHYHDFLEVFLDRYRCSMK